MGLDPSQLADFENLSPEELQKEAAPEVASGARGSLNMAKALACWNHELKKKCFSVVLRWFGTSHKINQHSQFH